MAPRTSVEVVTVHETTQPRLHGILLTWDVALLAKFIAAANQVVKVGDSTLKLPHWLTEPRGASTAQGFVQDTMRYLAEDSGNFHGTIVSQLTPMQSLQLFRRLGQIEMHPFLQACAKNLPEGASLVIGTHFFEDPGTDGVSTNLPGPPAPHRQLFR